MNNEAKTYQLIDNYLNERLSKEDMLMVENRLEQNEHFKNYFEAQQLVNKLIVVNEEANLKSKLGEIHKKSILRKRRIKLLLVAIGIIIFSGLAFVLLVDKDKTIETNFQNDNVLRKELKSSVLEEKATVKKQEEKVITIATKPSGNQPTGVLTLIDSIYSSVDSVIVDLPSVDQLEIKDSVNVITNNQLIQSEPLLDETPPIEPIICLPFDANLILTTLETCTNKQEGQLIIETENKKYDYDLNNADEFQHSKIFSKLRAGNYSLVALDENECPSNPISFEIEAVQCDFMIQPSQNNNWEINTTGFNEEYIQLDIYNAKSGQKVFRNKLNKYDTNNWSGVGLDGNELPMGNYVYVLSSQTIKRTGNITLVR